MIDRSNIKKMWVSADKDFEERIFRYVIVKNPDGSCLAVDWYSEKAWEEGDAEKAIKLICWSYCKEIPSEKYRPFKDEEITEEFFFFLFKEKNNNVVYKIESLSKGEVKINGKWHDNFDLFDNWEMRRLMYRSISGHMAVFYPDEWQPAGVKV